MDKVPYYGSEETKKPQVIKPSWASVLLWGINGLWMKQHCLDSPDNHTKRRASRMSSLAQRKRRTLDGLCGSHGNKLLSSPMLEHNYWRPKQVPFWIPLCSQAWTVPGQWLSAAGIPEQVHLCETWASCCWTALVEDSWLAWPTRA